MVDLSAEGRLTFDRFDANTLVYPEKWMSEGNYLKVGVSLTNTIKLNDVPSGNVGAGYWYEYSDENLRNSTFAYQMQTTEAEIHESLNRNTMANLWQYVDGTAPAWDPGHAYHYPKPVTVYQVVPTVNALLPAAGINRSLQVTLTEGPALGAGDRPVEDDGVEHAHGYLVVRALAQKWTLIGRL